MLRYGRPLRREKRFRDRLDHFAVSDAELKEHYRFSLCEPLRLIEELEQALRRRTGRGHAIPPHTCVSGPASIDQQSL